MVDDGCRVHVPLLRMAQHQVGSGQLPSSMPAPPRQLTTSGDSWIGMPYSEFRRRRETQLRRLVRWLGPALPKGIGRASMMDRVHTGGCSCGGVRFRAAGPLRPVVNCHCSQCRRTHGHVAAYTAAAKASLELIEDGALRWYPSSPGIRRGFCGTCGASLFWDRTGGPEISIAAGTLDLPTRAGRPRAHLRRRRRGLLPDRRRIAPVRRLGRGRAGW